MNRKILIPLTIAAAFAIPTGAHADAPLAASATCEGIVITAPATGSTSLSIDGAPPMAIEASTTLSYPVPQDAGTHNWTVMTIADGPWTGDPEFLAGDIDGCNVAVPVPVVEGDPFPVDLSSVYVAPEPTPVQNIESPWVDVALASPW